MNSLKHAVKRFLQNNRQYWLSRVLYNTCSAVLSFFRNIIANIKAVPDALRIKKEIRALRGTGRQIVYLFGSPCHSNLGDNAQTVCIHDWIKLNYPGCELFIFNFVQNNIYFPILKSSIQKDDLIFLHSGYHITELYPLFASVYTHIFRLFPENRIFFFPQTVNIATEKMRNKVKKLFNEHAKLLVAARDEQSREFISYCFEENPEKLLLLPDVVTTMIGRYIPKASPERDGILCCLRNDKEKIWPTEKVIASLQNQSIKIETNDTTIKESVSSGVEEKRSVITGMIDYFSQFKVIITDRYHGTIFSLIANTPVIVIDSSDHKLRSGVDWFSDPAFEGRIFYARTLEEIDGLVNKIVQTPELPAPPPLLYERYYAGLKDKIDAVCN